MKDNGLGIDFSELIETDTGSVISNESMPENEEEISTPVEEQDDGKIEVNVEEDKEEITSVEDAPIVEPSSSSLPYFKVLAKALYEKGVLSDVNSEKLDEMEGDEAELLIDMIKNEISKNVGGYKESLPSEIKNLIDNYEENVPLDKLIGICSDEIRLNNITEKNLENDESLQKKVIADMFKKQGMSETRIERRIQQFDDLGQLLSESKEALAEGKEMLSEAIENEKEAAKIHDRQTEDNRQNNLKSLKEDIDSTDSLIDGINITERERSLIYDSMTKPVETDNNGTPMNSVMVTRAKNPLGFEKLLHYYHSMGLFNIDDEGKLSPDISKIKTGAKKSAMDELNTVLQKRQPVSSGAPARDTIVDNDKMKENINAMKGVFN
jgi:hypothetical protein